VHPTLPIPAHSQHGTDHGGGTHGLRAQYMKLQPKMAGCGLHLQ